MVVNFTAILGGINVDLSKTDQVTSLDGGANTAVQSGFESVDVSSFAGFGAVVVGSSGANTIVGAAAASNLTGGAGADIITGGAAADIIGGGAGADVITGAVGADTITGGAGNDTFVYSVTAHLAASSAIVDSVDGGAGTDSISINNNGLATFTIAVGDDFARATTMEKIVATGQSNQVITITTHADMVTDGITTIDLSGRQWRK